MPDAKLIKPKKRCCKDRPRCKRCPVVCKKLMKQGYLDKRDDGRFEVIVRPPKKALKLARV